MVSIYIHIPFCVRKCYYCDFLSFPASPGLMDRYTDALCKEIRAYGILASDGRDNDAFSVYSVFFGGGTPSLLSPTQMEKIVSTLKSCFRVNEDAEISMECNPATADRATLGAYRALGINRLSIGLQSAVDAELKALGRIHDYRQFLETYDAARVAGFENVNVDIISAIPGQTRETYRYTLTELVKKNPEHISAYSLIIEEGTKFADLYGSDMSVGTSEKALLPLPDEDNERYMYHMTKDILGQAGYERYEISNYAHPGFECRHNNVYWTGGEYIGVGLGASSYLKGYRYKNTTVIDEYLEDIDFIRKKGIPILYDVNTSGPGTEYKGYCKLHDETEYIDKKAAMEEYMFLGLRRMAGVSVCEFKERFGVDISEVYKDTLTGLIREELIACAGDSIKLTDRGIDVSNSVFVRFLLD